MSIVIGLSGKIGSGKGAVCDILKEQSYVEYAFADPLKKIAITFGFEPHQVYGTQEQKLEINNFWGISGREFMQKFGTEICRETLVATLPQMKLNGLTVWARLFEKYYEENKHTNIVVGDVRFADEAAVIKRNGGYVICIVRDYETPENVAMHKSEMQHYGVDFTIENNGTLIDLKNKVNEVLEKINSSSL